MSRREVTKDEPTYRFDSRLIAGLDEAAVAEFASRWKNAGHVRNILHGVLTEELNRVILQSESRAVFDCPNALASLADLHGYRRGIRLCLKLLTNQDNQ